MKREQQDKLWNELSEEHKQHYREQYVESKTMSESKTHELLEDLFGSHNLNPKTLTYEDILKWSEGRDLHGLYNKLEAIGDLLLVAKYLNGVDWKPDWKSSSKKWGFDIDAGKLIITHSITYQTSIVYFRTEELAQQAVQILGEETIRLALSTDY